MITRFIGESMMEIHERDDGRTLEGCIVPYGQVAEITEVTADGLVRYQEQFLARSLDYQAQAIQRRGNGAFIWLNLDHQMDFDSKIGHCISMRSENDGAYAAFRLYPGNDLPKIKGMLRESHTGLSVNFADRRAPKLIGVSLWLLWLRARVLIPTCVLITHDCAPFNSANISRTLVRPGGSITCSP